MLTDVCYLHRAEIDFIKFFEENLLEHSKASPEITQKLSRYYCRLFARDVGVPVGCLFEQSQEFTKYESSSYRLSDNCRVRAISAFWAFEFAYKMPDMSLLFGACIPQGFRACFAAYPSLSSLLKFSPVTIPVYKCMRPSDKTFLLRLVWRTMLRSICGR